MKKSYRILIILLVALFAFTVVANASLATTAAVIGGGMVVQWLLVGYGLEFGSAQQGLAELYDRIGERLGDAFDYYWNNVVLDPNGNWKYGMNTAGLIPYWNPEYDQWAVNVPIPSEVHKEVYDYLEEEMVEGENEIVDDTGGTVNIDITIYSPQNPYILVATQEAPNFSQFSYTASTHSDYDRNNSINVYRIYQPQQYVGTYTWYLERSTYNNGSSNPTNVYTYVFSVATKPIVLFPYSNPVRLGFGVEGEYAYQNYYVDVISIDQSINVIGTVNYNPAGFDYGDIAGEEIRAVVPLVTNPDGTLYIGQDGVSIPDEDKYNDVLGEKKKGVVDIPDTPILDFPDVWNPAMPEVETGSITTVAEGVDAIVEAVGEIVPAIVELIGEMPQKVSSMMTSMGSLYDWVPVEPRGFVLGAISISILGLIIKFIVGLIP